MEEEKRGSSASIQACCFLGGGAVPCPLVLPCLLRRDEWPTTLVFGILGRPNTRVFRLSSLETYPQGWRLFLGALLLQALHFLKPFGLVTGTFVAQKSLYIWKNTVVFLPVALRYGTRTLFSFQGALLSRTKHIQIYNIEISNKVR